MNLPCNETMSKLTFRNAAPADEAFVNDLMRTPMREYVEATRDSDKDRVHYYEMSKFQLNGTKIIQLDGVDVGRMTVTRKREVMIQAFFDMTAVPGSGQKS